jgi:uncharacterized protein YaeQ
MAIKPTIYKHRISITDLERSYYDTISLTIALHPSETEQRLMARVLAYVINAQDRLSFTKGLSAVEEADIWVREMDDSISLWIDVGEPAVDRVKKAARQAKQVKVYSFNTKSDVWWQQNQSKIGMLDASIYRFDAMSISAFANLLERTMDYSITITGDSAYIATELGECEVAWQVLQDRTDSKG